MSGRFSNGTNASEASGARSDAAFALVGPLSRGPHTPAWFRGVRVAFVGEMVLVLESESSRLTAFCRNDVTAAGAANAYVVDGVTRMWPSSDDITLALLHADGALVLHDGRTGASLRTIELDRHDGEPRAALFSPHGQRLAVAGGAQLVVVDVATGRTVRRVDIAADRRIVPLAFSGNEALLAIARAPDGCDVIALDDGGVLATFEREHVVALSHDGDRVVTSATSNNQTFLRFRHPARAVALEAGWAPSSGIVAWGAFSLPGARVRALRIGHRLFDEDTGVPRGSFAVSEPHDAAFAALGIKRQYLGEPRAIAASRDGAVVVVADALGVHLWNGSPQERERVGTMWPHFGSFDRFALSADGAHLVTVGAPSGGDASIKLWRVTPTTTAGTHTQRVSTAPRISLSLRSRIDLDPGEPCMECCTDWVDEAELIDDARAALLQPTHEHDSCAPIGAGPQLDWLYRFRLDIETATATRVDTKLSTAAAMPAYPPRPTTKQNERYVVTGELDGRVRIVRADDGTELATNHVHDQHVTHLRFSPDGQWLATGARDGAVVVHRLSDKTGAVHCAVPGPFLVQALEWSPDSSRIVVVAHDARMSIVTRDGHVIARQTATFDARNVVRFWPDSEHVVAGGALYRLSDGAPVACLTTDARQTVLAAAPTRDGTLRIVTTPGGLRVEVLEATRH